LLSKGKMITALMRLVPLVGIVVLAGAAIPANDEQPETVRDYGLIYRDLDARLTQAEAQGAILLTEASKVDTLAVLLRNGGVPQDSAHKWAVYFQRYGNEAGIEPRLLVAMAHHESGLLARAINPDDPSYGLLMVMPKYWRRGFVSECGSEATPTTLLNPRVNICYGAYVAAHFARQHPRDRMAQITAYNNGSGTPNGYADKVLRSLRRLSVTLSSRH
jgi:hypothetical protein